MGVRRAPAAATACVGPLAVGCGAVQRRGARGRGAPEWPAARPPSPPTTPAAPAHSAAVVPPERARCREPAHEHAAQRKRATPPPARVANSKSSDAGAARRHPRACAPCRASPPAHSAASRCRTRAQRGASEPPRESERQSPCAEKTGACSGGGGCAAASRRRAASSPASDASTAAPVKQRRGGCSAVTPRTMNTAAQRTAQRPTAAQRAARARQPSRSLWPSLHAQRRSQTAPRRRRTRRRRARRRSERQRRRGQRAGDVAEVAAVASVQLLAPASAPCATGGGRLDTRSPAPAPRRRCANRSTPVRREASRGQRACAVQVRSDGVSDAARLQRLGALAGGAARARACGAAEHQRCARRVRLRQRTHAHTGVVCVCASPLLSRGALVHACFSPFLTHCCAGPSRGGPVRPPDGAALPAATARLRDEGAVDAGASNFAAAARRASSARPCRRGHGSETPQRHHGAARPTLCAWQRTRTPGGCHCAPAPRAELRRERQSARTPPPRCGGLRGHDRTSDGATKEHPARC